MCECSELICQPWIILPDDGLSWKGDGLQLCDRAFNHSVCVQYDHPAITCCFSLAKQQASSGYIAADDRPLILVPYTPYIIIQPPEFIICLGDDRILKIEYVFTTSWRKTV